MSAMAYAFYFLELSKTIKLTSEFKAGGIAVFQSASLNLTTPEGGGDNNTINISRGGNILLHIAIRRDVGKIVFNSKPVGGSWGTEESVALEGVFSGPYPTIRVYDHGDRFLILADPETIHYFKKRISGNAENFSYGTHKPPSVFSNILAVTVYRSFTGIEPHTLPPRLQELLPRTRICLTIRFAPLEPPQTGFPDDAV